MLKGMTPVTIVWLPLVVCFLCLYLFIYFAWLCGHILRKRSRATCEHFFEF
uniref:Uncharacterized protein n=1 Tax=Anguilla anguilla TaxID=7936 RepID=A0A0E9XVY6_ANGAN